MLLKIIPKLLLSSFILLAALGSCNNDNKSGNRVRKVTDEDSATAVTVKPAYNFYIENSASMDGYVSTESEFKNGVYEILTDLRSKDIAGRVDLNYINDKVCPYRQNAQTADFESFIKNLNPETFRTNGCERTTSNLPGILKRVISAKPDDVNILVSDFIFSTGKGNTQDLLVQQQNNLKLLLSEELRRQDFSTIVVKFSSRFNGNYFIESAAGGNTAVPINAMRPYYMMFFGKPHNLKGLLNKIQFNNYSGYKNIYYILTPRDATPDAKIIRLNKIGDFEVAQPASKLIINNAKPLAKNGERVLQFSLAANLNLLKIDENYLLNTNNYELPANYTLVSIMKNNDEGNDVLKGYTHIFTVKTNDVKQHQDVYIKLKNTIPKWVNESSTTDDANPAAQAQQQKTFGFKYLIDGIVTAYDNKYEGRQQFIINTKVSSNEYENYGKTTGFPWWTLLVAALVAGVLLYLKNKKH